VTTQTFHGDGQYGAPAVDVYGGTSISRVFSNPETSTMKGCGAITQPS